MDARLEWVLRTQRDLVAAWQLLALGWSIRRVEATASRREWRLIHRGVYALTRAPLTREQRWAAAVLSAPGTLLHAASAGACHGFRPWRAGFETVVRPGSGGPRMFNNRLLVSRAKRLAGDVEWRDGIPLTNAERTLIDLSPHLDAKQRAKATREAIRLKCLTAESLLEALDRHRGRRGTRALRELATLYAGLPIARARSDAEAGALARLAQLESPLLNARRAGEEADLVFERQRTIVEIDGPQFHLFPDEDERKERAWRGDGYDVLRLPSAAVFDDERPL